MSESGRVVVYYAIWATICAAVAGSVVATIHAFGFDGELGAGIGTAAALGAGQGVAALATGGLLARFGRRLGGTVLLGLLVGAFDFAMYLVQMLVPATELGWGPDIAILLGAAVAITLVGARRPAAAP